jgi:hypothetical protein
LIPAAIGLAAGALSLVCGLAMVFAEDVAFDTLAAIPFAGLGSLLLSAPSAGLGLARARSRRVRALASIALVVWAAGASFYGWGWARFPMA